MSSVFNFKERSFKYFAQKKIFFVILIEREEQCFMSCQKEYSKILIWRISRRRNYNLIYVSMLYFIFRPFEFLLHKTSKSLFKILLVIHSSFFSYFLSLGIASKGRLLKLVRSNGAFLEKLLLLVKRCSRQVCEFKSKLT